MNINYVHHLNHQSNSLTSLELFNHVKIAAQNLINTGLNTEVFIYYNPSKMLFCQPTSANEKYLAGIRTNEDLMSKQIQFFQHLTILYLFMMNKDLQKQFALQ